MSKPQNATTGQPRKAAYLTPKQMAEAFDKHVSTIARWTSDGLLPSVKISRSVLYDREAVEDALAKLAATTNQGKETK